MILSYKIIVNNRTENSDNIFILRFTSVTNTRGNIVIKIKLYQTHARYELRRSVLKVDKLRKVGGSRTQLSARGSGSAVIAPPTGSGAEPQYATRMSI
jgi:hypothetical protein